MINKIKQWLAGTPQEQARALDTEVSIAALLTEVMMADGNASQNEQQQMESLLMHLAGQNSQDIRQLLIKGREQQAEAVSLYEFTSRLKSLPISQREEILYALWLMAYSDARLDPREEGVIRQVAELLYIPHSRFIWLKHKAQAATGA